MSQAAHGSLPLVSVIMCNFNCADYIESSIRSALAQRNVDVEVVVIDDHSTDRSVEIVKRMMEKDARIRLLPTPRNMGPAGARNLGIEAARGEWLAVHDSDDLVHPDRVSRLIALAKERRVEIVADDLLVFDDAHAAPARSLLGKYWPDEPFEVLPEAYIASNGLYAKVPALGYLKPVFSASVFENRDLRYNENLRIAEDYDLILRMLASGKRFCVGRDLTYFYRKRSTSISHRLSPATVAAMQAADRQFRADYPNVSPSITRALDRRMKSIDRSEGYENLIDSLKNRDLGRFFNTAAANPASLSLLLLPVKARFRRLADKLRPRTDAGPPRDGKNLAFVSRQRIVGKTNGSSIYALSILEELQKHGHRLHYICPSPAVFGSWPYFKLSSDMAIFASISIRGGRRFGNYIVATDPRIGLRAVGRVAENIAMRLKLLRNPILGAAPYSIGQPLTEKDEIFLASVGPARADNIMFDYAFLTATRPYLLRPDAYSMVLMHDLFSSRQAQFSAIKASDSVARLDFETEMALLGDADRVIAIQAHEGGIVAGALGEARVLTAPMAVSAVEKAFPGDGARLLFVGSNTAPNVDAMAWFLGDIWPTIRKARPDAMLDIVGSVGKTVRNAPEGVSVHGLVDDLASFYRQASVVISPLRAGSGLKIKLIEALSFGKAVVATTVTCQGVEDLVADSVIVEDTAEGQTKAVLSLLDDGALRADLAERARLTALQKFGAEACYGGIVQALLSGPDWDDEFAKVVSARAKTLSRDADF